jgi:hypothetical protein
MGDSGINLLLLSGSRRLFTLALAMPLCANASPVQAQDLFGFSGCCFSPPYGLRCPPHTITAPLSADRV